MRLLRSYIGKFILPIVAVLAAWLFVSCEQWVLYDPGDGIHRYSSNQRRTPLEIEPLGTPGQELIDFPVQVTIDETALGDPALFFARRSDIRVFDDTGRILAVEVVERPGGENLAVGGSIPTVEKARLWLRTPRFNDSSLSGHLTAGVLSTGLTRPLTLDYGEFGETLEWTHDTVGLESERSGEPSLPVITLSLWLSPKDSALFDRGEFDIRRDENGRFHGRMNSLDDVSVNREWRRERWSESSVGTWTYVTVSWNGKMDDPAGGNASDLFRHHINGKQTTQSDVVAVRAAAEFRAMNAGTVPRGVEAAFTLTDL